MKKDFYATTLCLRPKVCRLRKGMVIIMKKNRLIIVLVCCTLLYMTGCGHSKDAERNVLRVGVVLYTQDDPFINALTECLRDELKKYDSEDIFVIGGESIYRQLLPYCTKAYITKIDHAYDADTYFPNLDEDPEWEMTKISDEQTYFDLEYVFTIYERR